MAVIDDVKEQWNKQKDKPLKSRIAYFMHYYLIWVIVIAAIAALIIALVHAFVSKKPSGFYAVCINSGMNDYDIEKELENTEVSKAGINTKEKSIEVDLSMSLTPGGTQNETDMGTITKLSAGMLDASLDVMTCDAWNFNNFVYQASFKDLRDVLSEKELEKYKDDIYYVDMTDVKKVQKKLNEADYQGTPTDADSKKAAESETYSAFKKPDPATMDDPVPVGIILSDSSFFKKNNLYTEAVPIFGFVNNSSHTKEAKTLLSILSE